MNSKSLMAYGASVLIRLSMYSVTVPFVTSQLSTALTKPKLTRKVFGYAVTPWFPTTNYFCLKGLSDRINGFTLNTYLVFDFNGERRMAQAKVLNEKETRRVLLYIASKKHSARNRCMFLMTANCGMRVGEVAALRICDVLTSDGQIVEEIRLKAEQTKGSVGRTVLLSKKMQEELHHYLSCRFKLKDLTGIPPIP
jgi:integrase